MTDCNEQGCQVFGPHTHADLSKVDMATFEAAAVIAGDLVYPSKRVFFGTSSFTCGPVELIAGESERVELLPDNAKSLTISKERIRLSELMAKSGADALLNAVAAESYWKGRALCDLAGEIQTLRARLAERGETP